MFISEPQRIIAVSARKLCPRPLWEQVPRIREAGIQKLILREKDLSPEDYLSLAEKVRIACLENDVDLIINAFPEAALKLGISKIHMPLSTLDRDISSRFETVGTSIHSLEQLHKAESLGATYVTAGHVFATDCKKGLPPRGLAFLREITENTDLPVYAIGGITPANFGDVLATKARGACIMSGAMRL